MRQSGGDETGKATGGRPHLLGLGDSQQEGQGHI